MDLSMIVNMINHHDQTIKSIATNLKALTNTVSSLNSMMGTMRNDVKSIKSGTDSIAKRIQNVESVNNNVSSPTLIGIYHNIVYFLLIFTNATAMVH